MSNYLKLLNDSLIANESMQGGPATPLEFLGEYVFNFTTYDSYYCEMFASEMLKVCNAITTRSTFQYIKDNEQWYLLMVNMPFMAGRLEWGTSIRGAFWDYAECVHNINTYSLFDGDDQIPMLELDRDQWIEFIVAMNEFVIPQAIQ